jgi:hypothetical protein
MLGQVRTVIRQVKSKAKMVAGYRSGPDEKMVPQVRVYLESNNGKKLMVSEAYENLKHAVDLAERVREGSLIFFSGEVSVYKKINRYAGKLGTVVEWMPDPKPKKKPKVMRGSGCVSRATPVPVDFEVSDDGNGKKTVTGSIKVTPTKEPKKKIAPKKKK